MGQRLGAWAHAAGRGWNGHRSPLGVQTKQPGLTPTRGRAILGPPSLIPPRPPRLAIHEHLYAG
jgi:hypothetical protein